MPNLDPVVEHKVVGAQVFYRGVLRQKSAGQKRKTLWMGAWKVERAAVVEQLSRKIEERAPSRSERTSVRDVHDREYVPYQKVIAPQ
jgi:molybdopterin synthase catalytic subunit